jgi:hypothetical protein
MRRVPILGSRACWTETIGESLGLPPHHRPSGLPGLQNNLSRELSVYFYTFDLLNRDGEFLVDLGIERRRELLMSVLAAHQFVLRQSIASPKKTSLPTPLHDPPASSPAPPKANSWQKC